MILITSGTYITAFILDILWLYVMPYAAFLIFYIVLVVRLEKFKMKEGQGLKITNPKHMKVLGLCLVANTLLQATIEFFNAKMRE